MTDVYELDGTMLREPEAAHDYLKEMLGFPAHYGRTADALYDCLTECAGETIVWITSAEAVHPKLARVFADAMEHHPQITVIFEENT